MGTETGRPKAGGLRRAASDGARGVLMAASCCQPDTKLDDCRHLWDLGREGEHQDGPATVSEPVAGHVHVVGTTR